MIIIGMAYTGALQPILRSDLQRGGSTPARRQRPARMRRRSHPHRQDAARLGARGGTASRSGRVRVLQGRPRRTGPHPALIRHDRLVDLRPEKTLVWPAKCPGHGHDPTRADAGTGTTRLPSLKPCSSHSRRRLRRRLQRPDSRRRRPVGNPGCTPVSVPALWGSAPKATTSVCPGCSKP